MSTKLDKQIARIEELDREINKRKFLRTWVKLPKPVRDTMRKLGMGPYDEEDDLRNHKLVR